MFNTFLSYLWFYRSHIFGVVSKTCPLLEVLAGVPWGLVQRPTDV